MGGVARIVVPVLAAMAGFVVVAEATLPRVPLPEDADVEARFEHLARDTEGYEVVALGASTVMRAFDPGAFDRELAARGHPMRSFNLGVPGAFQFEVDHLIDELLARAAVTPRWILVELPTRRLDRLVPPVNRFTDRTVYWHTPWEVRAWFRAFEGASGPAHGPYGRLDALRHAAWRWVSLGQGDRIAARWLGVGRAEREARVREVARTRGYRPFPTGPDAPQSDLRDQLLGSPEWFQGVVARVDAVNEGPPPYHALDPTWLEAQAARARTHGATLLYFTTPTILQTAELHALHRSGTLGVLFGFDSPSRHPELYRPENRFDPIHLNEAGARLFTRELADRFAQWLESERG